MFKGKRKNQKNSQEISPLNLLARGRRKNQKNSQAVSPLNSLGKREGRHKRIQAVSPSFLLEKGEENEKEEYHKFLNIELFLEVKLLNKNS